MRDLLPAEARDQAALARRLLDAFALHGYELVTLPIFEYASVLELGLGVLGEEQLLRFVEPETGAVVALRPDMTAQIARLAATRMADAPDPIRLCYQGSVLRRRRERARQRRQIPQAGVELLGLLGLEGDLEVLGIATDAARAAGLTDFAVDLGHAGIAAALIGSLPRAAQSEIVEALAARDSTELARRAERFGMRGAPLAALTALPDLHGGETVWGPAESALGKTPAAQCLAELRRLFDAVGEASLAPRLLFDLAETRDLGYYTGTVFQLHAAGPGRAIGAGGRYDGLSERFGRGRPAAGFAFGLDELAWALERAGRESEPAQRMLVTNGDSAVLAALRGCKIACAPAPPSDLLAHAQAFRYTHLVEITMNTATLVRVSDLGREPLPRDPRALGAAALALLERERTSD